jgi:hypothetical protein
MSFNQSSSSVYDLTNTIDISNVGIVDMPTCWVIPKASKMNICSGYKKDGTRCSRGTKEERYCWQHKNNMPNILMVDVKVSSIPMDLTECGGSDIDIMDELVEKMDTLNLYKQHKNFNMYKQSKKNTILL